MIKKIAFITGNKHKLEIAGTVLDIYGIAVVNRNIDVDEIQDMDIERIVYMSALETAKIVCSSY